MTLQWVDVPPEPEFVGPPKPVACVHGWTTHRWHLSMEEGMIGLSTDECRLCNDGIVDLEHEYIAMDFHCSLQFHDEHYADEVYVWWEVVPDGAMS